MLLLVDTDIGDIGIIQDTEAALAITQRHTGPCVCALTEEETQRWKTGIRASMLPRGCPKCPKGTFIFTMTVTRSAAVSLILTQSGKVFKRLSNLPEVVQSQEVKEPRFYCRISLAREEWNPFQNAGSQFPPSLRAETLTDPALLTCWVTQGARFRT